MIEIAWARRTADGRIVGVDQVAGGLACECVCTQCERPLVAAKGNIFAGLWYPVIIAGLTLIIGTLFIREKKDKGGFHDI